jgi:hypothetical protein
MKHFERFAAIDWSGAKGKRHKGIAIAMCDAKGGAPRLVRRDYVWSRTEVLDWLIASAKEAPTLYGFDFSFAPPIFERGEYLPGEPGVPRSARNFWAYVDEHCDDEDLGAASFLEESHRRHFYFGIADGVKAGFMHFRQCDARLNAQGGRKTASAYDAIGAAQVAKASFSGMRLLHRLGGQVPIWPSTRSAKARAQSWRYTRGSTSDAQVFQERSSGPEPSSTKRCERLQALPPGCASSPTTTRRTRSSPRPECARSPCKSRAPSRRTGLTPELSRTEGWTFGVL